MASTGLAEPRYQVLLDRIGHMDQATILLEAPESFCTDSIKESQRMVENIRIRLNTDLGVAFDVRLVEPQTLTRENGQRVTLVDRRRM